MDVIQLIIYNHQQLNFSGCVGRFTGLEGTLKWPRENSSISSRTFQGQSCNWVITSSNSSLVIKIQFTKINVPSRIHNCAFQYIEVHYLLQHIN